MAVNAVPKEVSETRVEISASAGTSTVVSLDARDVAARGGVPREEI